MGRSLSYESICLGSNNSVPTFFRIATSDSSGHISILSFEDGQEMCIIDKRKNHDFEAWICAFDVWNSNVVYSGGDDSKLFLTDLREDSKKRIGVHDAGVTSLLSDIFHEHWLFSGSYDEKLRLWDTRKTKQPLETHNAEGIFLKLQLKGTFIAN